MKRRTWLLLIGLAIAPALYLLAFGAADQLFAFRPGVTEANMKRIRKGMSRQEVEKILGGPATVADNDPDRTDQPTVAAWWEESTRLAMVAFRRSSKGQWEVYDKAFWGDDPSLLERFFALFSR